MISLLPVSLSTFFPLVRRLCRKGIQTVLLSGDREEAVANIAKTVGIGSEFVHASLAPQQKTGVISTLQASGHRVAMVISSSRLIVALESYLDNMYFDF